ncbi:hypothetical protein ACMAZE_15105 [Pseudopelagicola sp. nBUS_20]|uniref:hypothetical protein n=1 Tax=Pseudopelagicola sp. nBUS_20 TaxID=3395317 RepID=UPI003EC1311D
MEVTTTELDLGKDVFQVHGITADGTVVFNRTIRRRQLLNFFETLSCARIALTCFVSNGRFFTDISPLVPGSALWGD